MHRLATSILAGFLLLWPLHGAAQDATPGLPPAPVNLDFEEGDLGAMPRGWFQPLPGTNAGYRVERTGENPKSGRSCALIHRLTPPPGREFGNIMQTFDAAAYRGRVVRYSGSVRTEFSYPEGQSQLWLRIQP